MNRTQSIPWLNRGVGITANRSMDWIFNQDMKSQASINIIESIILTLILKDSIIATYYIGADVQSNNTELAIKQRGKIVARYSVPATIITISTVLDSPQGRKILAMEEGSMAGWLYRNDAPKEFEKLLVLSHRLLVQQILAGVSALRFQSYPGKELAATLTDMESIEYLGQYYADKINVLADNLRRS